MIKYGLISATDWLSITKCLDMLKAECDTINAFEIGVNAGDTSRAIRDYLGDCLHVFTGVDNQQDYKMETPFDECEFIVGDSVQVCHELSKNFYHFGFIDANHSFHRVIADFVAYAPKIKVGGILAFHDTAPHIKEFKDYQQVGDKNDPKMYIQVRQALIEIGLFRNSFPEWKLLFEDYDPNNEAGGVSCFIKVQ